MPILIVKPKILSALKKEELKKAGYVIIETNDPKDIQILDEFTVTSKDIVLEAAIQALDWGNDRTCRNAFGDLIRKKLQEKLGIKPIQ